MYYSKQLQLFVVAKHEFSALLTKEAGKPWNEADADAAEGIDFLEYYGRQMLDLKRGHAC